MIPTTRLLHILVAGFALAALPVVVDAALWPAVVVGWVGLALAIGLDLEALLASRVQIDPSIAGSAGVGDAIDLRLRTRSRAKLRCRLQAEVTAPLHARGHRDVTLHRGEQHLELPIDAKRRGSGTVAGVWARLTGPLGLLHSIRRVDCQDQVVRVVPNLARVRDLALRHFGAWARVGGLNQARLSGDGGEFDTLVKHTAGMNVAAIDWKATARHQELRTRRFRLERNQRVVFSIDCGRLMADPIEGTQRVDHAIHSALLLAKFAQGAGDLVGLHAYATAPESWHPPSNRRFDQLVGSCAAIEPKPEETNHVFGLRDLLVRLRRRTLVVVFTDFVDSTTAELMIEEIGHLARQHLVIFVALDDPDIRRAVAHDPDSPPRLAESVVAGELEADRMAVFQRLRRAGVHVVHGSPGPAAAGLVSRYLDIKRRELIG